MKYKFCPETELKARILTHGVTFTQSALNFATAVKAKVQNLVYNKPSNAQNTRPQELLLRNSLDGYETVVSCVAPVKARRAVTIDVHAGRLVAECAGKIADGTEIEFVKEPEYYRQKLRNGLAVKNFVSACGLDELNIFPWKGCAISKVCKFCGANSLLHKDDLNAREVNRAVWQGLRKFYLENLCEALQTAAAASCYAEHMHVILIGGNLSNDLLDLEADIFAEIAQEISPLIHDKASEGLVLVITPPKDISLLKKLYAAGISKVVFNLEAIQPQYFSRYCPGKNELGYDFFIERLAAAISVFGKGNVRSNLVLGLEPAEETLRLCEVQASRGVVMSANVLHMDAGNTLDCEVPSFEVVTDFFFRLKEINKAHEYKPYYCAKALRTSLTNEAHDERIFT